MVRQSIPTQCCRYGSVGFCVGSWSTYIDEGEFRVFDLKTALRDLTNVPPERQKILGLVKGKLPEDQVRM